MENLSDVLKREGVFEQFVTNVVTHSKKMEMSYTIVVEKFTKATRMETFIDFFIWDSTPEGYTFWSELCYRLEHLRVRFDLGVHFVLGKSFNKTNYPPYTEIPKDIGTKGVKRYG